MADRRTGAVFTLYEGRHWRNRRRHCTVDAAGDCLPAFTDLDPGTYTIDETTTAPNYGKDPTLPFEFTLAQGQDKVLTFTDLFLTGATRSEDGEARGHLGQHQPEPRCRLHDH